MELLAISLLSLYIPDRWCLVLDTHTYTTMLIFANPDLHSPLAIRTYIAVLALGYLHLTCLWVATATHPCSPFGTHTNMPVLIFGSLHLYTCSHLFGTHTYTHAHCSVPTPIYTLTFWVPAQFTHCLCCSKIWHGCIQYMYLILHGCIHQSIF
jgi:hypothetical protein